MTEPLPPADRRGSDGRQRSLVSGSVLRIGIAVWTALGAVALIAVAFVVLDRFRLVIAPLLIALFPAALLTPLVARLRRRGWRQSVAAGVVVAVFSIATIAVLVVMFWFIAGEFGDVADSLERGYEDVVVFVEERFGWNLPEVDDGLERLRSWIAGFDLGGTASNVALGVLEVVTGTLIGIVALFFYLKDGSTIAQAGYRLVPGTRRRDAELVAERIWDGLGGYFRGQLTVAFMDAVLIGIGLALLGVPLALPLAIVVLFGGLFPIIGAFAAGAVAVLVALADGGAGLALAVLVLNLVVQQVEGNLLAPLIVGRATRLHPLAVLASITAGAIALGVLGAFLAVPITTSVVRAVNYLRERPPSKPLGTTPG